MPCCSPSPYHCQSGILFRNLLVLLTADRVWWALLTTLIHRLRPSAQSGALQSIVQSWHTANDSVNVLSPWPEGFTRDIIAKPCHSHNDYSRKVPLYDALAAGCTGVEADVWLPDIDDGTTLRIGHRHSSLTADRTLASLYIQPLSEILRNLNPGNTTSTGIFETNSDQTLVLLIDFKSNGTQLWPLVNAQLEPLRRDGWLRHWNGVSGEITPGPLTVVATGNAPYDLVVANQTSRDIFFDAPLDDVSSNLYNSTNSYYASAKLSKAVGSPVFGHFKAGSMRAMTTQIEEAKKKELVSRYWGNASLACQCSRSCLERACQEQSRDAERRRPGQRYEVELGLVCCSRLDSVRIEVIRSRSATALTAMRRSPINNGGGTHIKHGPRAALRSQMTASSCA